MKILKSYKEILILLLALALVLWFFAAAANVEDGKKLEDKESLEEAVRRAAVFCYAVEGIYPSELEYLIDNYGLRIDHDRFVVKYEPIASNLMPDITVLESSK